MSRAAMLRFALIACLALPGWPALAVPAGCDLAFLPGSSAPTIDGAIGATEWADATLQESGGAACLSDLLDGAGTASLAPVGVRVYTKRDNANLYLAFDVTDENLPSGGSSPGDQVIVQVNPNNSRDAALAGDEHRLVVVSMRGSPSANSVGWQVRSGSGAWGASAVTVPAPSGTTWTLSNGAQVGIANRPAGTVGYIVEVKLPFTAIGYVLGAAPNDVGIAFAVVNDIGVEEELIAGEGLVWVMTGVGFPETMPLHIVNSGPGGDPLSSIAGSPWRSPAEWGTGFLSGAGDSIYFRRNPWWSSEDIRVGFCSAANFAGAVPGSANWYRYKATSPCPARVWGRVRRDAPSGVGEVKRRVLFLWAAHGANPQKWHFVSLSPTVSLPAPGTATTPGVQWGGMPTGQGTHPCLRAFILPESLLPGFDQDFFDDIGTEVGNNEAKIQQIVAAYGLADQHIAQMNIELVGSVACPSCTPCQDCLGRAPINLPRLAGFSLIGEALAQNDVLTTHVRQGFKGAVVDFQAVGVLMQPRTGKNYRFVDPLGGVRKMIGADLLLKQREFQMLFNVSNSEDGERMIFLAQRTYVTQGLPRPELKMPRRPAVYKAGQLQAQSIPLVVSQQPGDGGGGTGKGCSPAKLSSGPAVLAALVFGGVWVSRRRKDRSSKDDRE